MTVKTKLCFRKLTEKDLQDFKTIRLEALKAHPESFLGCYEHESAQPDSFVKKSINHDMVVGCYKNGKLLGIIGYYVVTPEGKREHSAKIWGFYIRPDYRGRGFAKKLFNEILDEAAKVTEKALLKVNTKNRSAIKLYRALGFEKYGLERKSLKIGQNYYDDWLMVKFF